VIAASPGAICALTAPLIAKTGRFARIAAQIRKPKAPGVVGEEMDNLLRNLQRQHNADPSDIGVAQQLIRAYSRLQDGVELKKPELSVEKIQNALAKCDLYSGKVEEAKLCYQISFDWTTPTLTQLNQLALQLGIDPEDLSVEADWEDTTQCSCGSCPREIESQLEITIDKPAEDITK